MSGSTTLGRLNAAEIGKPVISDLPNRTGHAILSNQDAMIVAIQALCAKLDADAGVTDTNYGALIGNTLSKILLTE